jgi:hypothetical protein
VSGSGIEALGILQLMHCPWLTVGIWLTFQVIKMNCGQFSLTPKSVQRVIRRDFFDDVCIKGMRVEEIHVWVYSRPTML